MTWVCDPVLTSNIVSSYSVAGPLFAQALQSFLAAHCALVGDHLWPADAIKAVEEDPNYDFIVIGAGSAGAVVANRLSEITDWKVLLVEAGGNPTLHTEMPQLFYSNMNTPEDWGYKTHPQEGACRGYKEKGCAWPRGKVLGGTSSINGMFYVRGNKVDYDEWAALGNKGWSYEEVLPYFKKSENFSSPISPENKKYHGTSGYLHIEESEPHHFEKLIIQACQEIGMNYEKDYNADNQMGVTKSFTNTKDGVRQSTARAFLSPIKDRKNLHVIKNAHVTKIITKPGSNVVNGVILKKDGKEMTIYAKKEIILSAGAINTPQLLMLSGFGPKKHLEELGIKVKADLPVGENLQDHLYVPFYFSFPGNKELFSFENIFKSFTNYVLTHKGPLADTSPHRVITFFNTTDSNAKSSDIQTHYIVFPPSLYNLLDIYEKHGLGSDFYDKFNKINENNYIIKVYIVLLHPKSRGKILLNSKDPFDLPKIFANYWSEPDDIKTVIEAIKQHVFKLSETQTLKHLNVKEDLYNLDACKNFETKSDEQLECLAREITFSLYHPTSTAKMGPDNDESAVVSPELRLRKVRGLRVVDASVMPHIVRGNTNAPVIMIAEKGADMIKEEWLTKHAEL